MTQVTLSNVSKSYTGKGVHAVSNLNLDIASQRLTALLGPSGCGKTTTMKMIAGLLQPNGGDILFDHQSILPVPPEKRGAVMVFQNYLLFPYMNVEDNVGFGLKMRGVDKATIKRRVSEILELVKLPGVQNRRPKALSGGQQQRIALARALIVEPKVLLLDEPLSNLDAYLRDEMRELIRNIQKTLGITTIFVTHDQEEAVVLADSIALMFDGVLQQFGEPDSFYEKPSSVRVARFFGGMNFVPGQYRDGIIDTSIGQFYCASSTVSNGAALMSIRPEAVVIGEGKNSCKGHLVSHVYVGTYTRMKVVVGDQMFEVVAEPGLARQFNDSDEIALCFPPEKIWLLPSEKGTEKQS